MTEAAKDITTLRRGPMSAMPKFEQEIERLFGDRWPRFFDWPTTRSLEQQSPNVDIIDREDEVYVRAELPGFTKKDIDVTVNDATVTIKASSEAKKEEEDGDYYRREISQEYMARTIGLPAEVDGEKAKARLTDGLLEITIPKVTKAKRQKIEIDS